MTILASLLKTLSIRDNLDKYIRLLNTKVLSIETIELIKDFQGYFEANKECKEINFEDFKTYFFVHKHPNLDEKKVEQYKEIINTISSLPVDGTDYKAAIAAFEQQNLYRQLQMDMDNNVPINTITEKLSTVQDKLNEINNKDDPDNQPMDLKAALDFTNRTGGLPWRLQCLQEHFGGGLIKGDFVIISGYVDSGKTSFVCSEVTHMAENLKDDEYVLWLNTEGNWQQLVPRLYCATLNCTRNDLTSHMEKAIIKYTEKMHGNANRIQVLNFQRKSIKDVEKLIKKRPPALIVFDLLDHIKGFSSTHDDESTRYGQLYQWARELATQVCPILAISQMNRNGNDNPYAPMTELSGSGEKKQAAGTAMIMIGSVQGNDTERYLSTPKNKIGGGKGFRASVKFDPVKSRFSD